jgi:hypothetical protein
MFYASNAAAVIGIAWALAWCTVEENRLRTDQHKAEIAACTQSGGTWTKGWGGPGCVAQQGN